MGESVLYDLCVLLLLSLCLFTKSAAAPATPDSHHASTHSSFLHLSPGLHLNMAASYNLSSGRPLSSDRMFGAVATPTLDKGGLFFPILSSPSFNRTDGADSTLGFGYSLGFYLQPRPDASAPDSAQNLYMAVCAGSLGSTDHLTAFFSRGTSAYFLPYLTPDGFAAPLWIANIHSPIPYPDRASLTVQPVADSRPGSTDALELQLRDSENVVWQVRIHNTSFLEMQDTGHLNLIDSSTNTSVWAVGRELVSNDSSYVARMEKGGLVFYMNKIHFNKEPQPPPYWVFPLYFNQDAGSYKSLNQMIASSPCNNSPAQLSVPLSRSNQLDLDLWSCSSISSFLAISSLALQIDITSRTWVFWRLEGDGMLYNYAVSVNSGSVTSVTRNALDSYGVNSPSHNPRTMLDPPLALGWQECSMPMACGPLGVCTPNAESLCSCLPEADFEPVNNTNMFQGCKRRIDLPNCNFNGTGHTGSTDFVQLNSTASILLFNEWTFDSTPGMEVDACKQSCSLDCSCNGFFYQFHTSSCFFIMDGITLLTVVDTNYTPILQIASATFAGRGQSTIFKRDYVTFLKVARRSKLHLAYLIALSAGIPSFLVCLLLGMVGYLFRARRNKTNNDLLIMTKEESMELQDILPLLPSRYSYRELFEATEGFNKLLGAAGGCGSVYAGVLPDGRKVAVKVLQVVLQGTQHSKQFLAEIATIGRTAHHNIVRLVGFCWEVSQRLLVYEYVERGSLDNWIFVKEPVAACADGYMNPAVAVDTPFLDWKARYNVALGIARGLTYLHEDCEKPILHFDIKPQNILLDKEFEAKLADFGMSRLIERDMSAVVTRMRGTPGYIAPEWCSQGTVSKKSDVYSMGMVLLEIVGGRKNLDFSLLNSSLDVAEQEAWHFPSWAAKKCEQGLMMELVDRRLIQAGNSGFDEAQAIKLIQIAFWCIQENPAKRPNAPTVVQWLEGISTVEQPPYSMASN